MQERQNILQINVMQVQSSCYLIQEPIAWAGWPRLKIEIIIRKEKETVKYPMDGSWDHIQSSLLYWLAQYL